MKSTPKSENTKGPASSGAVRFAILYTLTYFMMYWDSTLLTCLIRPRFMKRNREKRVRLQLKFWSCWEFFSCCNVAPRQSCFTFNHLFESGYKAFCGATARSWCSRSALTPHHTRFPGSLAAAMAGGSVSPERPWREGGCWGEMPALPKALVGARGVNAEKRTKNRNFQSHEWICQKGPEAQDQ